MATACKHFEICDLPSSADGFCILHLTRNKPLAQFMEALAQHLAAGRSTFRHVWFPEGTDALFRGVVFQDLADFRDVVIHKALILEEARLRRGLLLSGEQLRGLSLVRARIEGLTEIQVQFPHQILAHAAEFAGDVSIHVTEVGSVYFHSATFAARVQLRGRFQDHAIFDQATIHRVLDLADCSFLGALSFEGTRFEPSSEMDLRRAVLTGRAFSITGKPTAPPMIRVDDTTFPAEVAIGADLGDAAIRIVARDHRPQFAGKVRLTSVDLRECRLVGNDIAQIDFREIHWGRRFGRKVIFDETLLRRGTQIPFHSLKEAYQILKQKYQEHGDHATAGDFHYGEMEMRRRAHGWPRRVVSLEFFYWALSGYGISCLRAGLILAALAVLFAAGYLISDRPAFSSFPDALHFSTAVMTLQRPTPPAALSRPGQWLQLLEAILGPVQIALFALALRMRLKR